MIAEAPADRLLRRPGGQGAHAIRLVTQFDPPGSQAFDAAIPGGCGCCCCCCCCLASTVTVSAVAALQASRKARESAEPPANATQWVVLAGAAMATSAILWGIVGTAISSLAPSSGNLGLFVFGLGTVTLWGAMLWAAFRGVGFRHPVSRAAAFVLIGVIAFGIEAFLGGYIVALFFPGYLLLIATVLAVVIWLGLRPRGGSSAGDNPPPP